MAGSASPTRDGRAGRLPSSASPCGAVATSGRDRRRFGPQGRHHHLIDPLTGNAAVAGPLAVTVVGGEAAEVEAFATACSPRPTLAESRTLVSRRFGLSALVVPEVGTPTARPAVGDLPLVAGGPFARVAA